jgi:uncharacterized protein YjbI with pentapeptide repeats
VGDERATWTETEAAALELDAALEGEALALDPLEAAAPRPNLHTEILRIRWDTPRGRRVRAQVIKDIRFERSAHLAEILRELRGAEEVKGFLDLRHVRLDGENLNGTLLAGVDLSGASLAKTSLVSADLRGARLAKARLVGASLGEADLSRADLTDANLAEACLDDAILISADLGRARCIGATFRRASMVGANLRGAMLVRASWNEADLGGANVEGAHALARAFDLAAKRPSGLGLVLEVPVTPERLAPVPFDVAHLERTSAGALREPERPARERRPTGSIPSLAADLGTRWDAALVSLISQRGRVAKITAVIDGVERVLFGA